MSVTRDRRAFLRGAGATLAGAGGAVLIGACGGSGARAMATAAPPSTAQDHALLAAAQVAEALAVTTYTNIVDSAPFFANLEPAFQNYFTAARDEEMRHHDLLRTATGRPASVVSFRYPPKMFASAQVTLDTLVTLEDAFIAAYLLGVNRFSTPELRTTAARIMGVESDHRVLARVVGPNVARRDGGPITAITGAAGHPEPVDPPNNTTLERPLGLHDTRGVLRLLGPFIDARQARRAGFDTTATFAFVAFTPKAAG